MLDHPEYDRLAQEWRDRLDESPWSPELLEERILVPEEDKPTMAIRHAVALFTPTQHMEVISHADPS